MNSYEPLTPVQIESKLRGLVTALTKSQKDLSEARDAEVEAELGYKAAHRRALLDPERPRVERGGFTTAELAAWVDERCSDEYGAYRVAEARRKAAEDFLRVTRDQASVVQTLARSVQQAYGMAGAS